VDSQGAQLCQWPPFLGLASLKKRVPRDSGTPAARVWLSGVGFFCPCAKLTNFGEKVKNDGRAEFPAKAVSNTISRQVGARSRLSDSARDDRDFRYPPTCRRLSSHYSEKKFLRTLVKKDFFTEIHEFCTEH